MHIVLYARLGGGQSRHCGKMILKDVREVASSAALAKYGLVSEPVKTGNFFELHSASGMLLQKSSRSLEQTPATRSYGIWNSVE